MTGLSIAADGALVATSTKLAELNGLATPEAFDASNCSVGLASASFHSAVSVSRVSFQEFVALGKVTATERAFSILKKSLFNHCSGLGSIFSKGSETKLTFSVLPSLTYRPSGQPCSPMSPMGEGRSDLRMCFLPSNRDLIVLSL